MEKKLTPKRKKFLEEWYENNFRYVKKIEYLPLFNFNNLELSYLYEISILPLSVLKRELAKYNIFQFDELDESIIDALSRKYNLSRDMILKRIAALKELEDLKENHHKPGFSRKKINN